MQDLYPDILPYTTHRIDVGDRHSLYVEECGSPKGIPVVFLHGGPGAGFEPMHRRFFDPESYRVVLLDQRGCGRSTRAGGATPGAGEGFAGGGDADRAPAFAAAPATGMPCRVSQERTAALRRE